MDDQHYEVESIISRKLVQGHVEYLVKWQDWDAKYNSWVRACDMACPGLIEDFEDNNIDNETIDPFKRGFSVQKIHGADFGTSLRFWVQFEDKVKYEWVHNDILKLHAPQQLIKFYESRIFWDQTSDYSEINPLEYLYLFY